MTSERRAAANRRNALRSTGPRTAEGKRIAAQNAVTLGCFARTVLLPHEDAGALEALEEGLVAQFRPVGVLEEWFVARVVSCVWRLRRVQLAEAGVFTQDCGEELARAAAPGARSEADLLGAALVNHSYHTHQFATLARAEAALGREFYRALHELQRLQAARRGEGVAPPAAVDVTVSGPDEGPAIRSAAEGSMSGDGAAPAIILPPQAVRAAAEPPPGDGGEDPKGSAGEGEATGAHSGIGRNAAIAQGVDRPARGGGSPRRRRARRPVPGASSPPPQAVQATQTADRGGKGEDPAARAAPTRKAAGGRARQHASPRAARAAAGGATTLSPTKILPNEPTAARADPLPPGGLAPLLPQPGGGEPPPGADARSKNGDPACGGDGGGPRAPGLPGGRADDAADVPATPVRHGDDVSWPIYVATQPIEIGRVQLKLGDRFPLQDKQTIRGYARALGVPDGDRRPFYELPYVAVRRGAHPR